MKSLQRILTKKYQVGNKSHQELLHQMASENGIRNEIISETFQLNWDKMKPLIDNIYEVWEEVKVSLNNCIK